MPVFPASDGNLHSQGAEMVVVQEEAGPINPALPSPSDDGWEWKEDEKMWNPMMTTLPPAPDAIIHLVKCKSVKERCATKRCQCRKAGLSCTDLCGCCDTDDEQCENMCDDADEDEDYVDDDDNGDMVNDKEFSDHEDTEEESS